MRIIRSLRRKARGTLTRKSANHAGIERLEGRTLFATLTVNAAGGAMFNHLTPAIDAASDGDTILVSPGTYVATTSIANPFQAIFFVNKSLTIKSTGGSAVTTLSVGTDQPAAFNLLRSNTRLEGFTISGGFFGVQVQDFQGNTTLSNIVLEDLRVSSQVTPGPSPTRTGHGILLSNVTQSVVRNSTVLQADANGIFIDGGGGNLILNCAVNQTDEQHAIAIKNSSDNQVVGCRVNGSAFHGITLVNADRNLIRGNTINGPKFDGITLTDDDGHTSGSEYNIIADNVINNTGILAGLNDGTGIFLNSESNFNLVQGNSMNGAPENGIALFNVSYNLIEGNTIFGNRQGGIFAFDNSGSTLSFGNKPTGNVIVRNYTYDNFNNSGINLRGAANTVVAFNFVSGKNITTGLYGGTIVQNSSDTEIYHNTIVDLREGHFVFANSTGTQIYRNKSIRVQNQYGLDPAVIAWDAGRRLGGSYWSDQTPSPVGNPSAGTTPYRKQIFNTSTGATGNKNSDRYPFASESFGETPGVTVLEPVAGTVLTPLSTRHLRWESTGAVRVDLAYASPSTGATGVISANAPDTGLFVWTVPAGLPAASDYVVTITPNNEAGAAIGSAVSSPALSVGASAGSTSITILTQGRQTTYASGSQVLVGWKGAALGQVAVESQVDDGAWTLLATAPAGDNSVRVTLPTVNSDRARLRVRDIGTGVNDVMDGFFRIGTTAAVTSGPGAGVNATAGMRRNLSWVSPANSRTVDVGLITVAGGVVTPIASRVADFGRFTALIPDAAPGESRIRLTFRDAAGTTLSSSETAPFSLATTATTDAFDASITAIAFTPGGYTQGQSFVFSATVANLGSVASAAGTVSFIFSPDNVIGNADDILLGTAAVGPIQPNTTANVAPSAPFSLANVPLGAYFIGATVTVPGDASSSDDTFVHPAQAVSISPGPGSGFNTFIDHLNFTGGVFSQAQTISVSATLINQGLTVSTAPTVQFFLSTDNIIGNGDDILMGSGTGSPIANNTNGTVTISQPFSLAGVPTGSYFIGGIVTAPGDQVPGDNNYVHPATAFGITPGPASGPDLRATLSAKRPLNVIGRARERATVTITNAGNAAARGDGTLSFFTSASADLVSDATPFFTAPLKLNLLAGRSVKVSASLTYPALPDGTYFLIARVSTGPAIVETNLGNNTTTGIAPLAIAAPRVSLSLTGSTFPAAFTQGPRGKNPVLLTLGNSGNVRGAGRAVLQLFASDDNAVGNDTLLTSSNISVSVLPGRSQSLKLSLKSLAGVLPAGTRFIYARLVPAVAIGDNGAGTLTAFSNTAIPIS